MLSGLETVPIDRPVIVSALVKYLQRADQSGENRNTALHDLSVQSSSAAADPGVHESLKSAMPILLKELDNQESEARQAAIETLGHLGSDARPAEDAIIRLLRNDPEPKVRKAAENALNAIKEGTGKKADGD